MLRPARPEATIRGAAVGVVSFAASLTAHALAMRGTGAAMPGHHTGGAMPMTSAHAGHSMPPMASMPGHDMGAAGAHAMHDMTSTAMPAGAPSVPMTAVLVLALACAALGALAARPRTTSAAGAAAMLLLGQGAGHLALGLTMGHLALSPTMAAAHLAAAIVAGAVIAGAEHALRTALATLAPLATTWRERPGTVVAPIWTFRVAPLPVLARHGALRAPPR
ncbi:hypothetical protein [Tsukamurella pseudospumae]|uniref:Uncharacterized protein n=1 Tax=Tsukamurella pseudospumae TaxID=239498 RepID=A0A137ZPI9_9ACTN|nr:hypothetical protein [Tsukamurella pseudospumae]KXP00087.1 hypothetical protein AXK61_15965 [Tsukamurella pseudospumae]